MEKYKDYESSDHEEEHECIKCKKSFTINWRDYATTEWKQNKLFLLREFCKNVKTGNK